MNSSTPMLPLLSLSMALEEAPGYMLLVLYQVLIVSRHGLATSIKSSQCLYSLLLRTYRLLKIQSAVVILPQHCEEPFMFVGLKPSNAQEGHEIVDIYLAPLVLVHGLEEAPGCLLLVLCEVLTVSQHDLLASGPL